MPDAIVARFNIDAQVEPVTLSAEAFPFTGQEMAKYANLQRAHHIDRASWHKARFLEAVKASLPKGVHIDAKEFDIDAVEVNLHQGTMSSHTYSGTIGGEAVEAKRRYDAHRSSAQRMNRYFEVFMREPDRRFLLTLPDMDEFGMFRVS